MPSRQTLVLKSGLVASSLCGSQAFGVDSTVGGFSVKRFLFVGPLVVVAALIQAGITAEAHVWCSEDPAIQFVDAAGQSQTVYLTSYADGIEHSGAVSAQTYTYSIERSDGGHKTRVRLMVVVPDDGRKHFHVRFVVSTNPNGAGKVLTEHKGNSGHGYALDFEVRR